MRRLRNAERQLYDREEALSAVAELPDPLAALGAATQRPRFLDPEATRPLAEPVHRGRPPLRPSDEPADRPEGGRKRAPGGWDIASMAPPLKGTAEAPRGVISAPAKRYRTDERVGAGAVTAAQVHRPRPPLAARMPLARTAPALLLGVVSRSCPERGAAQVAMLGGQWDTDASGSGPGDAALLGPSAPKAAPGKASRPSRAMDVSEFVDKGGSAMLPRKQQERREKEKMKRLAGQSAIGSWKSETEMQQRQLYDS